MSWPHKPNGGGGDGRPLTDAEAIAGIKAANLASEMNRLETLLRFEPNLTVGEGENDASVSIAISLKRIADAFDRRTKVERIKEAHVAMVNELHKRNRITSLSEAMELVGRYFQKLTGLRSDRL